MHVSVISIMNIEVCNVLFTFQQLKYALIFLADIPSEQFIWIGPEL